MGFVIGIAVLELFVIAILTVIIVYSNRTVDSLTKYARDIAHKNIDIDKLHLDKVPKNMKSLAKSLNIIKDNIHSFIEATKGNVITLSDAITQLSDVARLNEAGTEETANSILVVSEKTCEQLDLVKDNLELIESNNGQLSRINSFIGMIQDALNNSAQCCQHGITSLDIYERDMNKIAENLRSCTDILVEFNNQITEINSIQELVVSISEQLRLLSFNASIEAARVGEIGKGFGVVSLEMKTMSDQTKESMDAINDILNKITESSRLVTDSINNCDKAFNHSYSVFEEVSNTLRDINQQSGDINEKMLEISGNYQLIADNSDKSRIKAENVFAASEAISDSTRHIAAISQENSSDSANMSNNVQLLENMLMRINSIINQFNTGLKPVNKSRAKKVKIAFFSPLDNFFWYGIRSGVNYAQKELADRNVEITYYYYEDNASESHFPSDVRNCITNDYDAIIYPGFMHGADKEMKEAVSKRIKLFTYNCDCDADIKRVSCFEPDQAEAGILAAKATAKAIGKKGKVAIVVGERVVALNKIRYDSFKEYITSHYKDISIVDTIEVKNNPEKTYQAIRDCLKKNPDLDAIYSTTGMQMKLVEALKDSGKAGSVKAIVFDKNKDILDCIKKGVIAAAIDHDSFTQGYYPIILMYNHLVDNMELNHERILCKACVIDKENIDDQISF